MRFNRVLPFKTPTIRYLRDFILDQNVEDGCSITLPQKMFDELAVDFRKQYNEPLTEPFVFLGLWVKPGEPGQLKDDCAGILEDDPVPPPPPPPEETYVNHHRCTNCGKIINERGEELTAKENDTAVRRWMKFGEGIFIPSGCNECQEKYYGEKATT